MSRFKSNDSAKKMMVFLVMCVGSTPVFGQQGGSGGVVTEVNFKSYMNKIADYLVTDEGKSAYPMIPEPNFHDLVTTINPVISAETLFDAAGNKRDCISGVAEGARYTKCDSRGLPEDTVDNRPALYRIIFHEMLVHAGIEKPVNHYIPSEYPISSSIADPGRMHLVVHYDWVLGGNDDYESNNIMKHGFSCISSPSSYIGTELSFMGLWKKSTVLEVQPDGQYRFFKLGKPKQYGDAKYPQQYLSKFNKILQSLGILGPHIKTLRTGKFDLSKLKPNEMVSFFSEHNTFKPCINNDSEYPHGSLCSKDAFILHSDLTYGQLVDQLSSKSWIFSLDLYKGIYIIRDDRFLEEPIAGNYPNLFNPVYVRGSGEYANGDWLKMTSTSFRCTSGPAINIVGWDFNEVQKTIRKKK